MSRAFDRFLVEFHAEWPEKKDGFDLENLRRLGGGEARKAFSLLADAVAAGDDMAVPALIAIDAAAALPRLRAVLTSAAKKPLVRVRIAPTLLEAGHDGAAEQSLVALARARSVVVRFQAIVATRHLRSAAARIKLLVPLLGTEADRMNRRMVAGELLHALGRQPGDRHVPGFRTLVIDPMFADAEQRRQPLIALGLDEQGERL